MIIRYSFLPLFCFLLFSSTSSAQDTEEYVSVYPIKVDNKWGYVKIFPSFVDTLTVPKFDYIGDLPLPYNTPTSDGEASPFRLFDLDGKMGLLNESLDEVMPNDFHQIIVVSDDFFALSLGEGFFLQDQLGQVYFDSTRFENICFAEGEGVAATNYFFTRKNGLWGLRRIPNDAELIPEKYEHLLSAGHPGYYKAKRVGDDFWTLLDTTHQQILDQQYEDIIVLDEKRLALQKDGIWRQYTLQSGRPKKDSPPYTKLKKVSQQLVVTQGYGPGGVGTEVRLKNFKLDSIVHISPDTILTKKNFYHPLDDKYAVMKGDGWQYLVNEHGQKVSPFCMTIQPTKRTDIYLSSSIGGMNLLYKINQNDFGMLEGQYDKIYDTGKEMIICKTGEAYGVIGFSKDTIVTLPSVYTNKPHLDSSKVMVQFDGNVHRYSFSPEQYFVIDTIIYEGGNLIGKSEQMYREAAPIGFEKFRAYQPYHYQISEGDLELVRNVFNPRTEEFEERIIAVDKVKKKQVPKSYFEVLSNLKVARYTKQKVSTVSSDYLSFLTQRASKTMEFVNLKDGQAIATPLMVGMRRFNRGEEVSIFIDPTGKMGILNQGGQELTNNGKPIRYTFIGPFVDGKARACKGGKLIFDRENQLPVPPKFSLGTAADFLDDFQIAPNKTLPLKQQLAECYAVSQLNNPLQWVYIDTEGREMLATNFDYVEDFNWENKTALVLHEIDKEVYQGTGKNDAVVGVIDVKGKLLVKPKYNAIILYKDFFLVNQANTPTFTFNNKGQEILINPTKPSAFSDGIAAFYNEEHLMGFVDRQGTIITSPIYREARAFSDGLALVKDAKAQYQFINKKGKVQFEIAGKSPLTISDFQEGKSWQKVEGKSWVWQCIDKNGNLLFEQKSFYQPQRSADIDQYYLVPMSFSNGLSTIVLSDTTNKQLVSAIINAKGEIIKQFAKQLSIGFFNEQGVAIVEDKGQNGLVNQVGELVIKPKYKQLEFFHDRFLKAQQKNGKWGILSYDEKKVIPFQYNAIGDYSDGLFPLKNTTTKQGGWCYGDTTGTIIIAGPFLKASAFQNGYASVQQQIEGNGSTDSREYIINKNGQEIYLRGDEPLFLTEGVVGVAKKSSKDKYFVDATGRNIFGRYFAEVDSFQLGIAKVKRLPQVKGRKELYGAINSRGVMIVPPKFRSLHIQPTGDITINPQRYFGLVDKTGNVLLEPVYDRIERFEQFNIFRVERGASIGYVRINDGEVSWSWELQK